MAEKTAVLENGAIRLVVTDRGTIQSIFNRETGCELLASEHPTGWKMITTLGRWREHAIFDADNRGSLTGDSQEIRVEFPRLTGQEDDVLDIGLTLVFRLGEEGEVIASARLENRSAETVREVWFPFISGFTTLDQGLPDHLYLPCSTGTLMDSPRENLPARINWWDGKPGGHFYASGFWSHYPLPYPGVASMAWMDFFNCRQGLYLGAHSPDFATTALLARRRREYDDFQLGFARYPFAAPGESWDSGPLVLRVHRGDWHRGADCYRAFSQSRISAADAPRWVRDMAGIQPMSLIHQNRHIRGTYEDIARQFDENRALGLNLPLFVFAWFKGGHDSGYPEYEPDPRLGGEQALKEAIRHVTNAGGKVILYTQGRLIDRGTDFYRAVGREITLKDEDGLDYSDEYSFNEEGTVYPNKVFSLACPSTRAWLDTLKGQIDLAMDLGASGILFDQIAGDPPFLCFDKTHPHAKPDMAFDAKTRLLKHLQEYAAERDPEFMVMSELVCDAFLQYMDLSHGINMQPESPEGPVRPFPDAYRYVFPAHRITSRSAQTAFQLNYAFALGLVLEKSGPPEDDGYTVDLLKLRMRLARFLVTGRYTDTDGFTLQSRAPVFARGFAGEGRERALVLFNASDEEARATVFTPREQPDWQVFRPGSDTPELRHTPPDEPLTVELGPQALKVLVVE